MRIKSSMDFGRAIKMARTKRGWSQSDLAEYLGSSQRWISEVENGKTRAELGKVLRCMRMLDITMEAEIGEEETTKPLKIKSFDAFKNLMKAQKAIQENFKSLDTINNFIKSQKAIQKNFKSFDAFNNLIKSQKAIQKNIGSQNLANAITKFNNELKRATSESNLQELVGKLSVGTEEQRNFAKAMKQLEGKLKLGIDPLPQSVSFKGIKNPLLFEKNLAKASKD